jgi:hypothetical protein
MMPALAVPYLGGVSWWVPRSAPVGLLRGFPFLRSLLLLSQFQDQFVELVCVSESAKVYGVVKLQYPAAKSC